MTKKKSYRKQDDISDVTGVRKSDSMLQVGSRLDFMKKYVCDVDHVSDPERVGYQRIYDRIFVKDIDVDDHLLAKLGCICTGTITIFEEDDQRRYKISQYLAERWWPAQTWDLVSNIGKCLVTNAHGHPRYEASHGL